MDIFFICLKIFLVRILDVSMGTTRTIIMVKGKSLIASFIGFIEVFIWFMIVREALSTEVGGVFVAISYSLGFAAGTFIGSKLSNKFIKGVLSLHIITDDETLDDKLREDGYAVTVIRAEGHDTTQKKYMLMMEIANNKLTALETRVKELDEKAFIVVTETKMVQNGYFK